MIQNIETTKLHPHYDNPRKDLGDLIELADSIKANGVLQNLTVVPWFSSITGVGCDDPGQQEEMGYIVVIGHRRLAAAKLAGITEVPCVISDMKLREQVSAMLIENMQRDALTPYEEAQGFQMMLNFGDSVNDIARRTGFSDTTVRKRVKLLDLDEDKFKAADARGATLSDFMELDKIKSIDRKNAVLDKIGTPNFQYELKKTVDAETQDARTAAWIEALSAFATQVDSTDGYRNIKYYYTSNEPNVERPQDADCVDYYFNISKYGSIYLLKKDDGQIRQEDPEEARRREKLEWRRASLEEATGRAYELRKAFVQGLSAARIKKHMSDIVAYSVWARLDTYSALDDDYLELLGLEMEGDEDVAYDTVAAAVSKSPDRALLLAAYCDSEDRKSNGYYSRWKAEHAENESLDFLYDFLEKLGYQMSDEERTLQDGTHSLYTDDEDETGESDTPCELCKSAHPSCDECCAVCEDKCNTNQVCRKKPEEES